MFKRTTVLIAVAFFLSAMQSFSRGAEAWEAWTVQQKRAWIYERLVGPVQDRRLRQAYVKKLAVMDESGLDRTIASQLRQDAYRQQLESQRALAGMRWGNRLGGVGFRPVISWLPTGTNLTAGAVVSADRRHVRLSLSPFFSSIPRVDTFNYRTGQSRNIYNATPNYTQSQQRSPASPIRPQHSWYKKIRTLR